MPTIEKIFNNVMSGESDNNIKFRDLQKLLNTLQFEPPKIVGSHHRYKNNNIKVTVNIQKDGNLAKGYQIKQIRNVITMYNLEVK